MERSVALRAAQLGEKGTESITVLQANRLTRSHRMKGRDALEITHDRIRETVARGIRPEDAKGHHRSLAHALEA